VSKLHFDVAEYLLDHRAGLAIQDSVGSTPLALAVRLGQRAQSFVERHMDDLTLEMNSRPSVLVISSQSTSRSRR
jgi:hypothetical protein